jgi:predicted RecA/RadA family phage recombinase
MADTFRLRHDDVDKVLGAVDSATVIEIGDLLYLDTDDLKPASSQVDQLTEEANQARFASKFIGVAMQASDAGDTQPIRVATDGIFEFPCPSGTWEVGDLVGASEDAGGTALEDQQVEGVARPECAIGYVAQRQAAAVTTVKVRLLSRVAGLLQLVRLEKRQSSNVQALSGNKTLSADDPRIQVLDPGGAGRDVTLPPEGASQGLDFIIHNAADAAEVLTIKEDGGSTICTPTQNETAYVYCDGTTWRGMVGANN